MNRTCMDGVNVALTCTAYNAELKKSSCFFPHRRFQIYVWNAIII